ncbi:hypothetical protein AQUCO_00600044v1 [Aquilegia coerulea]|uniref:RRM domain-containing protein n=1 Tax=Aquilegia coerulea TaxID=218851 RepID=A0A2G5EMP4_AQUCA|nr:hypothetical protein AQUCO_00600044v1 [Aquilegia coerulea]
MTSVFEPTTPVSSQRNPVKENAAPGSSTQASLYVLDLHSSVTETDLSDLFGRVGTVLSVKVCTNSTSNVSHRYGYVNYSDSKDAKNAMDLLNGELLNGKPMRIMFSNRDPSSWKLGASIFVKFFDKSLSSKYLDEVFPSFGSVLASNFPTRSNGLLEGHGCVQFEQEEDAQQARRLDGMLMGDGQVFVRPYLSKKERVEKKRENCLAEQRISKLSKVIVRNLPEKVEIDEFEKKFDFYGPVFCASIVSDKKGCSRGFGFVRYFRRECAARAIASLNGTPWYGKTIYVEYAKSKFERRVEFELKRSCRFEELQGTKLYMENIDDSINEEKLKDLFSEFGKITNCKVSLSLSLSLSLSSLVFFPGLA